MNPDRKYGLKEREDLGRAELRGGRTLPDHRVVPGKSPTWKATQAQSATGRDWPGVPSMSSVRIEMEEISPTEKAVPLTNPPFCNPSDRTRWLMKSIKLGGPARGTNGHLLGLAPTRDGLFPRAMGWMRSHDWSTGDYESEKAMDQRPRGLWIDDSKIRGNREYAVIPANDRPLRRGVRTVREKYIKEK